MTKSQLINEATTSPVTHSNPSIDLMYSIGRCYCIPTNVDVKNQWLKSEKIVVTGESHFTEFPSSGPNAFRAFPDHELVKLLNIEEYFWLACDTRIASDIGEASNTTLYELWLKPADHEKAAIIALS